MISRPLLSKRGRVDGDPAAHDPGRVAQGLLYGDVLKLVCRVAGEKDRQRQ